MAVYVITGGTTGIGAATRETLLEQGHEVFNIDYKDGDFLADLSTREGCESAINAVYDKYPDGIDVLICNAGIGGESGTAPLGAIDPVAWRQVFEVNTLAPLMMAQAFVEHVARSTERKLIAISSILGSIADNTGGRYIYRASKTALNMEWSCLARDLAPRGIICVALHPGWVQTDMGGKSAALTIDQSVPPMVQTIAALKPSDNGRYLQYDGRDLRW